eukprot:5288459-Ditylum_brightwellii.AAC.1
MSDECHTEVYDLGCQFEIQIGQSSFWVTVQYNCLLDIFWLNVSPHYGVKKFKDSEPCASCSTGGCITVACQVRQGFH